MQLSIATDYEMHKDLKVLLGLSNKDSLWNSFKDFKVGRIEFIYMFVDF